MTGRAKSKTNLSLYLLCYSSKKWVSFTHYCYIAPRLHQCSKQRTLFTL